MENTFECRDINGAVHEVPASEFTFRPSLYGVIVKDSKVLLHRYADGYDFPGGGINIGESLDDAFARPGRNN